MSLDFVFYAERDCVKKSNIDLAYYDNIVIKKDGLLWNHNLVSGNYRDRDF